MATTNPSEALVIGAGFAGIAAASQLAELGHQVDLLERHDHAGGRARVFEAEGFTFDMGPSWYWMPDVFEAYFKKFGSDVAKELNLVRVRYLANLLQALPVRSSRGPRATGPQLGTGG